MPESKLKRLQSKKASISLSILASPGCGKAEQHSQTMAPSDLRGLRLRERIYVTASAPAWHNTIHRREIAFRYLFTIEYRLQNHASFLPHPALTY